MLLSGGIDSATCLYLTKDKYRIRALTFVYEGIAERELNSAGDLAKAACVAEHRLVRLPDLKEASEIGGQKFPGYPPTYIPMRNSVFYSFAASFAEEVRADYLVGGHNKDDLAVFRDTSPRFFAGLEMSFRAGSKILAARKTRILRPLEGRTKAQVVKLASRIGVPLELTWSCHRDGGDHCWECAGCAMREEAFGEAGTEDPLRNL
ncbi:MAG: 7-cyano-7-deazaguanine synthase [Thaumarchaeota archaeon]|nr:7-cyano-7-deazaguanine synthase [Nitrososphaerota archaeon]